jgi:hypothetical protein
MAKARYLAQRIFPKLTPNDALSRMSWDDNGRLFYIDDKGDEYYAEPAPFPFKLDPGGGITQTGSATTFLRELPSYAASKAGPSMSTITAAGGAVLTPEFGGLPGAAAGAMAGDAARQGLAAWLTGETRPLDERMRENLGEGLEGGLEHALLHYGLHLLTPNDAALLTPGSMDPMASQRNLLGIVVPPSGSGNIRSRLFDPR